MKNKLYIEQKRFIEEQNELRRFQEYRILPKPKTTYCHTAIYISFLFAVIFGTYIIISEMQISLTLKILCAVAGVFVIVESFLRFVLIKLIECYQHYAKEETRRRCMCIPSCSEYAIMCLKKYLLIKAIYKITVRLFHTCKGDTFKVDYP